MPSIQHETDQPVEPAIAQPRRILAAAGVGIGIMLVATAVFSMIVQLSQHRWPGEVARLQYGDSLPGGVLWRPRAVELTVLMLMVFLGAVLVRLGCLRWSLGAFRAVLVAAVGVALSIPVALVATQDADATVSAQLDQAWEKAVSSTLNLPEPPPLDSVLAAKLWRPTSEVAHLPVSPPQSVQPDQCTLRYGATAVARQHGVASGVYIIERAVAFPSAAQAAAYAAAAPDCVTGLGEVSTPVVLPRIAGAAYQRAQVVKSADPPIVLTQVQMRFGSVVILAYLGPFESSDQIVTTTQAAASTALLARAAAG